MYKFKCNNLICLEKELSKILSLIKEKQYLLLNGELGCGKTTLVKVLGKLLNIKKVITSPSFNYMKVYDGLIHIDLYNYKGDLDEFEDYFEDNIIAIEWPDLKKLTIKNFISINIYYQNNERVYEVQWV
ncbi:tRNA (adenosine(37)-N6)-threonylcarbamoyltransferase complex ATPase subunit type 1 TsaE [Mycoplasmopsis felis]|uniref:tRNA (adenosine(37)-N6)-threonylcarbamoyltransferase complex ATPase subunit type 1 TsaE n=1 Tax=Mycoplasmopsis felis TaxID=33923 RepID=UPI002AFEC39E|nr:tRNA (adenosine(37)-N6)-threonylcarbamoyltransferase complex ATPase subunit type 1 TsaE [Mycoplasmopsis felis]WQQ04768.1 tRNA (adenosine(37)-N6)-threonylcarbamoyltransferase complex ATPase subunit type 1 TsaE [Mycoplasmopsis felis]